MGRPTGSGNKTPEELLINAEMLKKKAELLRLERERQELAKQRKNGGKNDK